MPNLPRWTIKFDGSNKLGTFWHTKFNSGRFIGGVWTPYDNGTSVSLYLYINLPADTEIIEIDLVGQYVSNTLTFNVLSIMDGYNGTGNILDSKVASGNGQQLSNYNWIGDIHNAKSIFIEIPQSNPDSYLTSVTISGYGLVDPFEVAFDPNPVPPVPTEPPSGGNILGSILGTLDAANKAIVSDFTAANPDLGKLLKGFEDNFGQDLPSILALFGINVTQYGTALQAAFQALIDDYQLFIKTNSTQQKDLQDFITNYLTLFKNELVAGIKAGLPDTSIPIPADLHIDPDTLKIVTDNAIQKWHDSLPGFLQPIGDFLIGIVDIFVSDSKSLLNPADAYLKDRVSKIQSIIDTLDAGHYSDINKLIKDLFGVSPSDDFFSKIVSLLQLYPIVVGILKGYYQPTEELVQQLAYANIMPKILPLNELFNLYFRGQIDYKLLVNEMKKHGYSEEKTVYLLNGTVQELNKAEIEEAFLRGFITEKKHDSLLTHLTYDDESIAIFKKLYTYLPQIGEVFNMAQRGLFDPKLGSVFNQSTHFPDGAKTLLNNLGVNEDMQTKLWSAHWQLPGFSEVLEMYHRGLINDEILSEYSQLSPMLPYFRDKLIQVSHRVLSRLDIRKLLKSGQLSADESIKAFQAIGYTHEDAIKLTNYAVKYDEAADIDDISVLRKRVAASVENQYKAGKIDRNAAYYGLTNSGIAPESVNKLLDVLDIERNIELTGSKTIDYVTRAIKMVSDGYIKGLIPGLDAYTSFIQLGLTDKEANLELHTLDIERTINEKEQIAKLAIHNLAVNAMSLNDFTELLKGYDFNQAEIDYLYRQAQIAQLDKTTKIGQSELKKFHKDGIITDEEAYIELQGLGYSEKYIQWILTDWGTSKPK